jgi:hypothetical protein
MSYTINLTKQPTQSISTHQAKQTISNLINQYHSHDIIHDLRYITHQLRNNYITPDQAINSTHIIIAAYGLEQPIY